MASPPSHPPHAESDGPELPGASSICRALFAATSDGACLCEDGRILAVNDAALRLLDGRREELTGRTLADFVAADSLAAAAALLRPDGEGDLELRLQRWTGSGFPAELCLRTLSVEGRRLQLALFRDLTARQQGEDALHAFRTKLGLALAMARLGTWEFDVASGSFTFNDEFYKVLGTTADREGGNVMPAGEYARRFLPPEEAAVVGEEVARAIAAADPGFTRELEHQFIRADGSTGVMLVRFAIVKDATGRTVRTYGVNQDITERKQAEQNRIRLEEQLQQAQKMEALGTLAGGIAHDFNNILTGIIGHLQLARMDLPAGHPSRAGLEEATKAGRRARDLVTRILAFSRRSQIDRRPVSLGHTVQEAMQLLRASLPATIEIRTTIDPDCPPVLCDTAQIHQVLMNLGTNAAHAMRDHGGILEVGLGRANPSAQFRQRHPQVEARHTVLLSVRDDGRGMDEAVLKRIFEPFYTTKDTGEGTGLGLTMVYSIIQNHQGAIVVESTPGVGTRFDLFLPPAPVDHAGGGSHQPFAATPIAPFGRGRPLLVVDDDEAARGVVTAITRKLGFAPAVFSDPVAALAAFQAAPGAFSAVLTDLTMPGMTGLELARQLFAIRPQLPLLLTTGYLDPQTEQAARQAGIARIVRKPFDLEEIATQLRAQMGELHG